MGRRMNVPVTCNQHHHAPVYTRLQHMYDDDDDDDDGGGGGENTIATTGVAGVLVARPNAAHAVVKVNKALGQESFRRIRDARKQLDSVDVPLRSRKFEEVQVLLQQESEFGRMLHTSVVKYNPAALLYSSSFFVAKGRSFVKRRFWCPHVRTRWSGAAGPQASEQQCLATSTLVCEPLLDA